MTSIGGSPIHEGHTRVIRNCRGRYYKNIINDIYPEDPEEYYQKIYVRNEIGGCPMSILRPEMVKLLVVVNCDDFLIRKHGFVFQNENSRAEILDSIKDVDYTYIHQSDKQTIDDAIHYFQPHYFCKGGDRSNLASIPNVEIEACHFYGTEILFGVGGTNKVSSSSDLIKRGVEFYKNEPKL